MKRAIVLVALLALAGGGVAAAYQAVARQRDYAAFLTRGDAALRDDQTFAAIEAYSGAIALHQDSMIAYLRRGQTYQRRGDRGDLERAASDFRTASTLDPTATKRSIFLRKFSSASSAPFTGSAATPAFERGFTGLP